MDTNFPFISYDYNVVKIKWMNAIDKQLLCTEWMKQSTELNKMWINNFNRHVERVKNGKRLKEMYTLPAVLMVSHSRK